MEKLRHNLRYILNHVLISIGTMNIVYYIHYLFVSDTFNSHAFQKFIFLKIVVLKVIYTTF